MVVFIDKFKRKHHTNVPYTHTLCSFFSSIIHKAYNTLRYSTASYNEHTIRYDTVSTVSIQYNTAQLHTTSIQYDTIQYSQHTIQHSTASYNEHTIRYDTVQHHTAGTCGRGCGSDNSDVDGMPDGGSTLPQISQDFRSTALRYVHAGHAANTRSQSDRISVSTGLPMVSAAPSSSSSASAATESFVSIPDEDGEECRTAHAAYVDRQRTVCNECRNE